MKDRSRSSTPPRDDQNRETNNAKIRRGIEQLDRGEGIPEDQLDAYLAKLKTKPE
jgi:predicted transcriptional regulator